MISFVEIYLVLMVCAWFFADWMIHHPPAAGKIILPGEIALRTSDGVTLSAIWLPDPAATHTILFSHGNGEDLDAVIPMLRRLQQAGYNVFSYDYRGYGRSAGRPSEKGIYRDIEAAYAYLTNNLHIPEKQIIAYGRSVGSGPACYLASVRSVGALVLQSPFTSAFRVAIPFPLFPFDQFPNLKRLAQIHCPLLVIHGTADTVVPFRHGKKIFDAYGGSKQCLWIPDADHNGIDPTDREVLRAMREFLHP